MFQKCPKCNGEGTVQKVEINMEWKPGMNNGPAFYYANVSCPNCLGEFVIHEEQGVPPSKVKSVLCHCDPADGCMGLDGLCRFRKQINPESLTPDQKAEISAKFKALDKETSYWRNFFSGSVNEKP